MPIALAARTVLGVGDALTFISVMRLVPTWCQSELAKRKSLRRSGRSISWGSSHPSYGAGDRAVEVKRHVGCDPGRGRWGARHGDDRPSRRARSGEQIRDVGGAAVRG